MSRPNSAALRPLALLLILSLLAGCLPLRTPVSGGASQPAAPGAPNGQSAPPAEAAAPAALRAWTAAELNALPLPEQLRVVEPLARDQSALRLALDPTLAPAGPIATPRAYEVGDRLTFWVHDTTSATNEQVEAELVHRTDKVYAWVARDGDPNLRLIKRAVDNFSETIYPAVTALFGSEPNPGIDGDPRLHILHTTGMGFGVAGYFSGADANPAAIVPFSNEKEMFYISLDWLDGLRDSEEVETVLAHEFQHMIHFNNDRNEEVWINEGLSEYAQEAAGYPPDTMFANLFTMRPDIQLNTWGGDSDNGGHYGASYLFVRYLVQRYGEPIAGELVREPLNGIDGVRAVLARYGATFEEVYADWLVANALDDADVALADGAAGRFGYAALDPSFAKTDDEHDKFPVRRQREEVANFGADYVELRADTATDLMLRFAGDTSATIAEVIEPADGGASSPANRFFWSGRTDDSEARLSRTFDLSSLPTGAPATLTLRTWWSIEDDYDFGYVLASTDGEAWTLLEGQRSSAENPTGNNLGVGYTGDLNRTDADGWVTDSFDLSDYAGGTLYLRFSYVTDDAVNEAGWLIDEVQIDAIGYAENLDGDAPGWSSEGWLLTDGHLTQEWLLQLVQLDGDDLVSITEIPLDATGAAELPLALDDERNALLIISAVTEGTTLPASYEYTIEPRP